MARSEQTAVLIEVLEGPNSGGVFELAGRELPYRAGSGGQISFAREQRTKLTWYPGNRTASQQIIGPKLLPTTFSGVWKERYLGEDRPIDLVELFEELCDQGSQVRVSWQTIVRQGIVKSVKWSPGQPVGGLTDIGWEVAFEWSRADVPRTIPRLGSSPLSLRDELVEASASLGDLIDALEIYASARDFFVGLRSSTFRSVERAIQSVVTAIRPSLATEVQAASEFADEPQLPARLVESANAATGEAIAQAAVASDILVGVFPADATIDDSLPSILLDAIERYDANDAAFEAMEQQFDARLQLEELARPPTFARVVPLSGTDLRDVAIEWYGDADLWLQIAQANGLEDSKIPEGLSEITVPLGLSAATDPLIGET